MDNNKLIEMLKNKIEESINEEYIEYKKQKLQDLDTELELKRNGIVKNILNSITILNENTPYGVNIMIKVENRIIQK